MVIWIDRKNFVTNLWSLVVKWTIHTFNNTCMQIIFTSRRSSLKSGALQELTKLTEYIDQYKNITHNNFNAVISRNLGWSLRLTF